MDKRYESRESGQLPHLPYELVERIFLALDPGEDSMTSVRTLCRCRSIAQEVRAIASSDNVWRAHYRIRWRHGNALVVRNYMEAYRQRHMKDVQAAEFLDRICANSLDRLPHFEAFANDLMMDVYDKVDDIRTSLSDFEHWTSLASRDDAWLSRHYWASEIKSFILRRLALRTLHEVANPTSMTTFEAGLAAFGLFRAEDPLDVTAAIEDFAQRCKAHIQDDLKRRDLYACTKGIRHFMTLEGYQPASPAHFHDLENNFVGQVLKRQRASLPMTLVWIFCATAQRLGIDVAPIGFPSTIITRINGFYDDAHEIENTQAGVSEEARDSVDLPFYYNVFHDGIASRERLEAVLQTSNLPQGLFSDILDQASTKDMVLRSARNIYNSLSMAEGESDRESLFEASYASAVTIMTLAPRSINRPLLELLTTTVEVRFPYDAQSLLAELSHGATANALTGSRLQEIAEVTRIADQSPLTPKRRDPSIVRHKVGQVFTHKLYRYNAVILDYNISCDASPEWQRAMNVHALDRQADQPFYHALVDDGSTRYVAEENIQPMQAITSSIVITFLSAHPGLGRFFRNADLPGGRFLLSADLEAQHPD